MLIRNVQCPKCAAPLMVDQRLWAVGTVRLRCAECEHYFLPADSPRTDTVEGAAIAGVPIRIWEPPTANPVDAG